ncbi:MAG: Asp/Glu/hydantoin racemase [Chloroflexota bacterium]
MIRVGMITPSSNTMVEPITSAITAGLWADLSVHYARITVTRIAMDAASINQFEREAMLGAARLLADARVDLICWNGTSAGWKGLDSDRQNCAAIQAETGIRATSATLGQMDAFRAAGVTRYALATPYLADVHAATKRTYAAEGFECVSEHNLGISTNFEFAEIPLEALRDLIRRADSPDAQAIAVVCTNLAAARVVEEMERELSKPIHDTLILALWHPLQLLGWDKPIPDWGALMRSFGDPPPHDRR